MQTYYWNSRSEKVASLRHNSFYRFKYIAETGIDSPIPKPYHAETYTSVQCKIISRGDRPHAVGKSPNGNKKQ